jgi:hypothetical protein
MNFIHITKLLKRTGLPILFFNPDSNISGGVLEDLALLLLHLGRVLCRAKANVPN